MIDTLTKIAESGKADAETYDLLGRAYATTGRADEAVKAFQKAQALAPNDVGVQTRLATVRMGMGEPNAAMGDLEHTLELAPKLPAVGEALFFAALATGDMTKTADALDKIKAAEGDTPVVENLTGLLHLAKLDVPDARKTFTDLTVSSIPTSSRRRSTWRACWRCRATGRGGEGARRDPRQAARLSSRH